MTREDLITKTAELEATLKANEAAQTQLTKELNEAKKQLENINKPKITSEQADLIYEAIEIAAESYRFDDPDQYEVDFSINYDSRLCVENIEFKEYSELTNEIYQQVEKLFNVTTEETND
jgi:preprotein translocase subunit SecD